MRFPFKFAISTIVSFTVAFVLTAFMAGYLNCADCDNFIERIFLGLIWILLGILAGGGIPLSFAEYKVLNIWPIVIPLWLAFSVVAAIVISRRHRKTIM